MVNNYELIKKLLKFEAPEEFYFVQVLQRSKENPDLGKNNRLVKAYYLYTLEYFERKWEEMLKLATTMNARIYIHLNRRNAEMIAFELMEDLAHCMKSNQIYSLDKLYNSVCGRHSSEKDKSWIVDVDGDYLSLGYEMVEVLKEMEPIGEKIIAEIPTKNGYHLITKPFNSQKFGQIYPHIEIHKNNPTVIFCP